MMKRFLILLAAVLTVLLLAVPACADAAWTAEGSVEEFEESSEKTDVRLWPVDKNKEYVTLYHSPGKSYSFDSQFSKYKLINCPTCSIGKANGAYWYKVDVRGAKGIKDRDYLYVYAPDVYADYEYQIGKFRLIGAAYTQPGSNFYYPDCKLKGEVSTNSTTLEITEVMIDVCDMSINKVITTASDKYSFVNEIVFDENSKLSKQLDFGALTPGKTYLLRTFVKLYDWAHYDADKKSVGLKVIYLMDTGEITMTERPGETTVTLGKDYEGPKAEVTKGNSVKLRGTITADNGYLTYVGAFVYKKDKNYYDDLQGSPSEYETAGEKSYKARDEITSYVISKDSVLNTNCKFGTLPTGSYVYVIAAKIRSQLFILKEVPFTVVPKSTSNYSIVYYSSPGDVFREQSKVKDKTIDIIDDLPTKAYYTCAGWDTDSSATTVQWRPGKKYTANKDLELHAVWEPKSYILHYDARGGSGAPAEQTASGGASFVVSSTIPQRSGYRFTGWSSGNGTCQPGDRLTPKDNEQSITLYANWEPMVYSVTFYPNGGVGNARTLTRTYNSQAGVGSKWLFYRPNYSFVGWAYSPNATKADVVIQPDAQYWGNADATFYAVWEEADSFTWTLRYSVGSSGGCEIWGYEGFNGSSQRASDGSASVREQGFTTNEKGKSAGETSWSTYCNSDTAVGSLWDFRLWLPKKTYGFNGNDSPYPAGFYTFVDGTAVEVTENTPVDHDMIIYPYWQFDTCALIFDANGGSGEPLPIVVSRGESVRIPNVTLPRNGDLEFIGWASTSDTKKAEYTSRWSVSMSSDRTLYAVWRDRYSRDQTVFAKADGESTVHATDGTATLRVIASSLEGSLSYSWFKGYSSEYGSYIFDASGASLTLNNVKESGSYVCKVTGAHKESVEVHFYVVCENLSVATKSYGDYYMEYNSTPTLTVDASVREGDVHYQWQKNYQKLEGETGSALTLEPVTGWVSYECNVTDDFGNSQSVCFNVYVENGFRVEPDGYDYLYVDPGESITLEVKASCTAGELTYQWYDGYGSTVEETSNILVTGPINEKSVYRCTVTDQYGNSKDAGFEISVRGDNDGFQSWVNHTETVMVAPGETATLTAKVPGYDGEAEYSWWTAYRYPYGYFSLDEKIPEAVTDTFETESITKAKSYYCDVNDPYGNYQQFYFHVLVDNELTVQEPEPLVITEPGDLTFTVNASCKNGGLRYQWYEVEGIPVPGANSPSYTVLNVAETRTFLCNVTDEYDNLVTVRFEVVREHEFDAEIVGSPYVFVRQGETAVLQVSAASDDALSYRWYSKPFGNHEDFGFAGETSDTYHFQEDYSGIYQCHVTDSFGNTKVLEFQVFYISLEEELAEGETLSVSIGGYAQCGVLSFTPTESGEYVFRMEAAYGAGGYLFDGNVLLVSDNSEEEIVKEAMIVAQLEAGKTYTLLLKHVYEMSGRMNISVRPVTENALRFSDETLLRLLAWQLGPMYLPNEEYAADPAFGSCMLSLSDGSAITEANITLREGDENLASLFTLSGTDEGFVLSMDSYDGTGSAMFVLSAVSETGSVTKAFRITTEEMPLDQYPTQYRTRVAVDVGESVSLDGLFLGDSMNGAKATYRCVVGDSAASAHAWADRDGERFTLTWTDEQAGTGKQIFTAYETGSYYLLADVRGGANLIKSYLCEIRVIPDSGKLILPEGLTEIGTEAFAGVAAEMIVIPEECVYVADRAFADCPWLLVVSVPWDCAIEDGAVEPWVAINYR